MAEASWTDAASRNMHDPTRAPEPNDPLGEAPLDLPELPESASPASNPALNRSAEAVGRGVGNAVAGVRRLPERLDKLRSRIHLVPRGGAAAEDIKDAAREAAADLRDAAEDTVSELTHRVKRYTHEASTDANRRWVDFRRLAGWRIHALRQNARRWLAATRHWESERPEVVIAACAAAAFAAGVALRIWRSGRD